MTAPDFAQTNPTCYNQIAFTRDPQFAFGGSGATASVCTAYGLASADSAGPYFRARRLVAAPGLASRLKPGKTCPPRPVRWRRTVLQHSLRNRPTSAEDPTHSC